MIRSTFLPRAVLLWLLSGLASQLFSVRVDVTMMARALRITASTSASATRLMGMSTGSSAGNVRGFPFVSRSHTHAYTYTHNRALFSTASGSDVSDNLKGRTAVGRATLDAAFVAQNPEVVKDHLKARSCDSGILNSVDKVSELRNARSELIVERDAAKNVRNTLSQQIGKLMKEGKADEANALKLKVEESSIISSQSEEKLAAIDSEMDSVLSFLPNLLDDRTPNGQDEKDNIVVHSWGDDKRKIGSDYKWHDELAQNLRGLASEAAARISGARFSVLVGDVARLERALVQYFLDFHVNRGYQEVSVPYIVSRTTLEGTGQLPKFEADLFKVSHTVSGQDAFLIPTAEVPVTNLYREQLLNATQLPIRHVCYSPSFRAEAGSYGRDTRGLLRQHQFHKVELVKICTPETSAEEHEAMALDAEELLQSLDLPYRRLMLCSGDIGFSARICYDLEVWLPGQQAYREISSISNCYDFQSRRMSLRYRPASIPGESTKTKKPNVHPHTLNGSGVAVGRALVAILENHQLPNGDIAIPEKLRPYMGGLEVLTRGSK